MKRIYYRDDSTLGRKVCIDIRGGIEYALNCVTIDGMNYVKGIDLHRSNGEWVLYKAAPSILDHETNIMKSNSIGMIEGVVNMDKEGRLVFGYFTPNPYNNCTVHTDTGNAYKCLNTSIMNATFYKEDMSQGVYKRVGRGSSFSEKRLVVDNSQMTYNIEDNEASFDTMKHMHKNSRIPIDKDIRENAKYIGNITFGAELETINGYLPENLRNKYGIIICKDGSTRTSERYPPEYVTVPLHGAKGIQTLRNVSTEIAKRSGMDINCSYHLHIGNIAPDRLYIVSLYRLAFKIQNDIFAMFPYYKTNPRGVKNKNYCKKLPNIFQAYNGQDIKEYNKYVNSTYIDIYSFLSGGLPPSREMNRRNGVSPFRGAKWNIKTRYYWINFINLIFHKRETVEFRVHTPTLNPDKIVNWLYIAAAIVNYAQRYPAKCISHDEITLKDVLNYYADSDKNAEKISNNLIAYYDERVAMFKKDYQNNDIISAHELNSDDSYSFNILK